MTVWIVLAVGLGAGLLSMVRALRRGWADSSPAAIAQILTPVLDDGAPLRRTTDEEIESTLTADLFAGVIDADLYRRALEMLAAHDGASAARSLTSESPRD